MVAWRAVPFLVFTPSPSSRGDRQKAEGRSEPRPPSTSLVGTQRDKDISTATATTTGKNRRRNVEAEAPPEAQKVFPSAKRGGGHARRLATC
jgi:hypothetical protein